MNDQPETKLEQLLAQATESLREAVSKGPSRELIDSTIDRLRTLGTGSHVPTTTPEIVRRSQRRNRLPRLVCYCALSAAVLISAFFAGWWILLDRTAMPAFAEVIQQVAKVKSVTFVSNSTLRNDSTKEIVLREHVKWYVQGQQLRMEDTVGTTATFADLAQKHIGTLDLKRKTAFTHLLDDDLGELFANPIGQIQQLKAGDAKLVGNEVLDGRKMQLYELDKVDFLMMGGKGATSIWVDPQTQLPVKIVIEPKKLKDRSVFIEITNFDWNKELDESLFRVPGDYKIIDANRWMRERREDKPQKN